MALLWSLTRDGVHYEVRGAGRTRRLYTDGVFHSQYHPQRPVTGGVWDLLFLPVFMLPDPRRARCLVLGVGGGAVLRLLARHAGTPALTGVELDPVHLQVARRFFGVEAARLVRADARDYVRTARPGRWDLVVDDLFAGHAGDPVRSVRADAGWCRALARLLGPEGVLVMNFGSEAELHACGCIQAPALQRRFPSAFRLTLPGYENAVGVFCRRSLTPRRLRARLAAVPSLRLGRRGGLHYRIRTLWQAQV
ncbi:MAG: methyltransferase domain-containing protein [Gammaproteobacteria bacterium]|nr:MAG: methyltransferase domain-containing protein [Gammaproteobacteria bacterium]